MKNIAPTELKEWLNTDKPFILIDIREGWERELYNIGGQHIPMGDVMEHKNDIPLDKLVVFYCEKGIRSTIIIQRLEAMGYTNLYNLSGGMTNWKKMA